MKIMCLNGWGGMLHQYLLPYLNATAPDVLCLQEVVHSPATAKAELMYRDGDHVLKQRANFFDEVCAALPEHAATFCPAAQGELWDGDTAVPSRWGLATFVHRALAVVEQRQAFVHKTFSPNGFGEHPRSRCGHAVRVYDQERDRMISITQMHGLRDLNGKGDTPERRAQALRLVKLIREVQQPDDIGVVCGDFNVEPGSETLRILEEEGFSELVTGRGHEGTRTSHYSKPQRFADYMLVSRNTPVVNFDVVRDPEVSDHCPLQLEI